MNVGKNMQQRDADVFWGEISPCEHFVQIYADDEVFLDTLEGFIGNGLRAGDSAIVIATAAHRDALETRLLVQGIDLAEARRNEQYIDLDAEQCLAEFIVNGWPDDDYFVAFVNGLLKRARRSGRKVRAFGEMVALLWARGDHAATVRLEHIWQKLCQAESFSLFCAYPKSIFLDDMDDSIGHICLAHNKIVAGDVQSKTEVVYKAA